MEAWYHLWLDRVILVCLCAWFVSMTGRMIYSSWRDTLREEKQKDLEPSEDAVDPAPNPLPSE